MTGVLGCDQEMLEYACIKQFKPKIGNQENCVPFRLSSKSRGRSPQDHGLARGEPTMPVRKFGAGLDRAEPSRPAEAGRSRAEAEPRRRSSSRSGGQIELVCQAARPSASARSARPASARLAGFAGFGSVVWARCQQCLGHD
ncbi:hypothetical protein MUK42_14015 [Musa troglodytarum]|uniref:Uncharacterized protein n=1 Tax=Musa troglodytarum TaxID=320322 RepID=A0A9E7I1I1_9LILI|nr:hypothetical protein MUK42_14015 [Musa troglodytarum]